jgi:hypothetical protein
VTITLKPAQIVIGLIVGATLAGGGYALAASQSKEIHGCVSKKTHGLTAESRCPKGTSSLSWGIVGPKGAKGAAGAKGASGVAGVAGAPGTAATVAVGAVTTGSTAAVTNSGSSSAAVLNFTLPSAGGVTAYGQVWPGASGTTTPVPALKNSNSNVVAVSGETAGTYGVTVKGCSATDESEPVITESANADPHDPNFTQAPILAGVLGWQTDTGGQYNGDLSITFSTVNSTTGTLTDSDFAFSVIC